MGSEHARRPAATRSRRTPYMSERQTQAYLLARDTVRRIQRTASLVGAMSQRPAGPRPQGERPLDVPWSLVGR